MKYLQPSFTIEKPAQITCCEGCVYGAEVHAQFCERCRPLCWLCTTPGEAERWGSSHVHYLTDDGTVVIPADPPMTLQEIERYEREVGTLQAAVKAA
ncbi:MAG: hypothetical protein LAP40_16875 [Acidobacteriia bacterium]|nr:hypothetical protein [Terriglobia bacterium]